MCAASAASCSTWRHAPSLPDRHQIVLDQLVISSDTPLPQRHRLLSELAAQRGTLGTRLGLTISDEPIYVYLFATAEQFRAFMRDHYPTFPDRRAFFVESDTRLMVYAYFGDNVAEDLRHEVAHGYLHSVVPNLPLWLDEGLAEYFEVPRGSRGLNRANIQELTSALAQGWHPDLCRLERLQSAAEMTQIEYAEAWAWVHWLLETTPDRQQLLRDYLQRLGQSEPPEPLSAALRRMNADCDKLFWEHVGVLAQSLR